MRVRVRFTKLGRVRWTSHRDVARIWERTLRRAGMPLAYSSGFVPHPLLSFGLALPTGCESLAEYLDVALSAPVDPAELMRAVSVGLPAGVDVNAAAPVEPGTPSLQEDVTSCTWEVHLPDVALGDLSTATARVLGSRVVEVERSRKGRTEIDDVRPALLVMSPEPAPGGEGSVLRCELATRPRGVRPAELGHVLGLPLGRARRISQWIERDGSRREPLVAGPAPDAGGMEGAA